MRCHRDVVVAPGPRKNRWGLQQHLPTHLLVVGIKWRFSTESAFRRTVIDNSADTAHPLTGLPQASSVTADRSQSSKPASIKILTLRETHSCRWIQGGTAGLIPLRGALHVSTTRNAHAPVWIHAGARATEWKRRPCRAPDVRCRMPACRASGSLVLQIARHLTAGGL